MEQGLALLPKMLQSIEVLQLTTAELLAKIDQELERNETLVAETVAPEPELASEPGGDGEDVPEWGRLAPASASDAADRKQAFLQNLPDRSPNLIEQFFTSRRLANKASRPPITA